MNKRMSGILLLILSLAISFPAGAAVSSSAAKALEEIPVQNNGRIKPFRSFADEAAVTITGKYKWEGLSSTQLVWDWLAKPEEWFSKPIIPVPSKELQKELPLMIIKGRISPEVALSHQPFVNAVHEAQQKRNNKDRLTPLEQSRLEVYDHAFFFQKIAAGEIPGWIAHPEDPKAGWLPLQSLSTQDGQQALARMYTEDKRVQLQESLQLFLRAVRESRGENADAEQAREFSQALSRLFESRGVFLDRGLLNTELFYIHLHPFSWAWKFYLLAAILLGFAMLRGKGAGLPGLIFFASGFLLHLLGFYLRCVIAGRPPVTNMYESIIWVSWAAVFFSMILFAIFRNYLIPFTSACVAVFALVLAQSFPAVLDPTISPLVPVLRSNYWLTIHVLTITLSYGAFALAWGLGHGVIFNAALRPERTDQLQTLSSFLYRTLQIGVILLAAGTVLGGVWANYSWGRFWGWDPKETWALIALLGYLTVLHGRFAGWLDTFGLAVGSVIAFLGILMAWYGVNFVLAAGLHSYGFGGGGVQYVAAAVAIDFAIIGWAVWRYKDKMSKLKLQTP